MAKSEPIKMTAKRISIKPIQGVGTYIGILFRITPLNPEPIPIAKEGYYVALDFKDDEEEVSLIHFVEADAIIMNDSAQVIYYPKNIFTVADLPITEIHAMLYYYPKQ